jgi:hypothetical protein
MKTSDFLKLPASLPYKDNVDTFFEISKNDKGEECVAVGGYCEGLSAIKFDNVKANWYGLTLPNQVRSCDALFVDAGRFYLIEFKTGKPENIDIHRKIYDSVIALIEHNVLTLLDCRERLQYIVVSRHYKEVVHDSLLGYLEDEVSEPWEYVVDQQALNSWGKHEIRKLTNFLFSRVYKLSLSEFDRFARNRNWSN